MNKGEINLEDLQERRNGDLGEKKEKGNMSTEKERSKAGKDLKAMIVLAHEREMMRLRKLACGVDA